MNERIRARAVGVVVASRLRWEVVIWGVFIWRYWEWVAEEDVLRRWWRRSVEHARWELVVVRLFHRDHAVRVVVHHHTLKVALEALWCWGVERHGGEMRCWCALEFRRVEVVTTNDRMKRM